jgi:pimeloyl-ACP methyl ester carboxylesterase
MPVVVRDGADLYWEKIGAGPALILGAGLNGSGKWWDPNRLALAERFTVYTFDQRGTGRSSKIPVASIEQMAADLVAVMDNAGLVSAHYAGHSTGGGIGVATALDFPGRLRSLLICCSTTCGDPYRQKLLGLRRRLYEQLGGEAYAQFRTLLLFRPTGLTSTIRSWPPKKRATVAIWAGRRFKRVGSTPSWLSTVARNSTASRCPRWCSGPMTIFLPRAISPRSMSV